MIANGSEAFLGLETAEALGLGVGNEVPLSFWTPGFTFTDLDDTEDVIEPIGHTTATVVGVGAFPDEILADGLYPRRRLLVTPEVAAPFDCTPEHPRPGDPSSLDELISRLAPPDCALSYRYFSLRVAGGDDGVGEVTAALYERFNAENEGLPRALRDLDIGFLLIPTLAQDAQARVAQSLAPSVTALRIFGVASAASTLAIVGLVALRGLRRSWADLLVWQYLGATRPQRATAGALPLTVAAAGGLLGALGVGWLTSGIGPVASARVVAPDPSLGVPVALAGAVLGASALVLVAGAALVAWLSSRAASAPRPKTSLLAEAVAQRGWVALTLGARAAVGTNRGPGGGTLVIGPWPACRRWWPP